MRDLVRQSRSLYQQKGRRILYLTSFSLQDELLTLLSNHHQNIFILQISKPSLLGQDIEINVTPDNLHKAPFLNSRVFTEPKYPCIGFLVEETTSIPTKISCDQIAADLNQAAFYPSSVKVLNEYIYPVYTDRAVSSLAPPFAKKKVAIITDWFFGNGDAVMVAEVLNSFINKMKHKHLDVDIITRRKTTELLHFLHPECSIFSTIESNSIYNNVLNSQAYEEVYFTPFLLSEPPLFHLSELFAKSLDVPISDSLSIRDRITFPSIPPILQQQLKQPGFKIGFQCYTQDPERSWPKKQAEQFIKLCKQKGITVYLLTPTPFNLQTPKDVSKLTLPQLFTVIHHLDGVVSVDSVCGHIAGALGIPNLTIWGRNFPHLTNPLKENDAYTSFRALSNNYSLVPRDAATQTITATIVFQKVQDLLNNRLMIKNKRISSKDILNWVGTEWVNK